jgi:hypothetical protein
MLRTAISVAMKFQDQLLNSASRSLSRIVLVLMFSGVLAFLPTSGNATGLDCPAMGSTATVPNILSDLQVKLVSSGNSVDITNEINYAINKLQIAEPNISYDDLSNVMTASYCRVVANIANLTAAEKWKRMRQFDSILRQQVSAHMVAPGTLIIANVPLQPAVFRELRSQAVLNGQSPAKFMAAILSRAAVKQDEPR